MTRNLPPVTWLRTFESAARNAGFAAAADELGLTPAAVSQQIRALEGRLGFPLFHRLARGVALTEMGRAWLPSVQRAFDDLAVATAGLFGVEPARMLTVRAPLSFATLCLAPRLAGFRARYPQIPLRLCTTVWGDALGEEAVDVDIRYGQPLAGEPLTRPGSVPACPPDTDFGDDALEVVAALARERAIHIAGCEGFWALFARQHGLEDADIGTALAADTSLVALEMVAAGIGTAMIAADLAERHRVEGRITVPPDLVLKHDQAHHVVLPGRPPPAGAVLFRDWLIEAP